jgi:hypothetical protein
MKNFFICLRPTIFNFSFLSFNFLWASRFAAYGGSRRAIRGSLRSYLRGRFAPAWYGAQARRRCYPSR